MRHPPASRSSSTVPSGLLAEGVPRLMKFRRCTVLSTASVESTAAPTSHPAVAAGADCQGSYGGSSRQSSMLVYSTLAICNRCV